MYMYSGSYVRVLHEYVLSHTCVYYMNMHWAIRAYTTCLCTGPYVCVLQVYVLGHTCIYYMFMYWAIRAYTTCLCTVPNVCVLQAYVVQCICLWALWSCCLFACLSFSRRCFCFSSCESYSRTLSFHCVIFGTIFKSEPSHVWPLYKRKRRARTVLIPRTFQPLQMSLICTWTLKLLHVNRKTVPRRSCSSHVRINSWWTGLPGCQHEKSYDHRESVLRSYCSQKFCEFRSKCGYVSKWPPYDYRFVVHVTLQPSDSHNSDIILVLERKKANVCLMIISQVISIPIAWVI